MENLIMEQDKYTDSKDNKVSKVRRRLFADDDDQSRRSKATDENSTNKFLEEIYMDRKKMEKKWNFDFTNGRPLPGRWEYVRPHENFKDNSKTDDKL